MTLFADPMIFTVLLAVFAATSAIGTSIVIGVHFEKLRRETAALRKSMMIQGPSLQQYRYLPTGEERATEDQVIARTEMGAAASLLNGHDPSKHVRFV